MSGVPPETIFAVILIAAGWVIIIGLGLKGAEPSNKATREVPRIRKKLDEYSPAAFEASPLAVREQFKAELLECLSLLMGLAFDLRPVLTSNNIERQTRAWKVWPDLLNGILDARATYRAVTGMEAPGLERFEALKQLARKG